MGKCDWYVCVPVCYTVLCVVLQGGGKARRSRREEEGTQAEDKERRGDHKPSQHALLLGRPQYCGVLLWIMCISTLVPCGLLSLCISCSVCCLLQTTGIAVSDVT